jgi:hypothetical protein
MKQRLENLGWHEIETIDDDLGTTAAGTVTRQGFERMVAEVYLWKVGVVAARELSRFARNNREPQADSPSVAGARAEASDSPENAVFGEAPGDEREQFWHREHAAQPSQMPPGRTMPKGSRTCGSAGSLLLPNAAARLEES